MFQNPCHIAVVPHILYLYTLDFTLSTKSTTKYNSVQIGKLTLNGTTLHRWDW